MKLLKADCVCLLCHTYVVPVVHVHLKHSISWHVAQRPHLNSITRLNSECEHLWSCIPLSVENWLQCVKHDDPKCLCWTTLSQSLHMLMTEDGVTHTHDNTHYRLSPCMCVCVLWQAVWHVAVTRRQAAVRWANEILIRLERAVIWQSRPRTDRRHDG